MTAAPAADPVQALLPRIAAYYGRKILQHGPTPMGVDWTCEPTQQLRFVQLLRLCDFSHPFSLNDVGCGYGALLAFLARRHADARIDYLGCDLAPEMIDQARRLWGNRRSASFEVGGADVRSADYAVASGIFNVRMDEPLAHWEGFISQTLRAMSRTARRGFAVNFLRTLPPGVDSRRELYRTQPTPWRDFCVRELGGDVTVLDSYGMREFTLLVRS